jgi:DNA-binding transcriptional LysR family regulator
MSKLPDFEGLAMFAKVAEERSYAGAARSTGVSVATVSRAVSRLEDRLGSRLFNRSSRRLALNDFGREFADRAAHVCAEAEDVEYAALETAKRPRGLVRLAAPMSFGTRWVGPILPDFFRQYPDIAVDLHLSDDKVDLIGDGFDAALRIAVLEDSSLVAKRLAPVGRFIVATPSYLARYGHPYIQTTSRLIAVLATPTGPSTMSGALRISQATVPPSRPSGRFASQTLTR